MKVVLFIIFSIVMGCIIPKALMPDMREECLEETGYLAVQEMCREGWTLNDVKKTCDEKKELKRYREFCDLDFRRIDIAEECQKIKPHDFCALCYFDQCNNGLHSSNGFPEGSEKYQECEKLIKKLKGNSKEDIKKRIDEKHEQGRQNFKNRFGFWPEEIKNQKNKII